MFSSLLPRPKHSNYDPKLHYRIPAQAELSNTIQVQEDETSITTLSAIHQLSNNSSKTYDATIPLKVRFPNLVHNFPRPPPDAAIIEETRAVLTALLEAKSGTQKTKQTSYISYNENATGQATTNDGDDDGATAAHDGKIIQIETMQEDPLLPPKHKLRKNRHQRHDQEQEMGPILKKSAKVSKEDRQKWNIPAAISNWKNNSGFTIALDKRVIGAAAGAEAGGSGSGGGSGDGGSLNVEKFGALNQALNQAEVQAREDIARRNELRQQLELQEKRQREEKIREIANRSKKRRY